MRPRDPEEPHRTATPLELFFDLAYVVAPAPVPAPLTPTVKAPGEP